jgi:hypothetical protein
MDKKLHGASSRWRRYEAARTRDERKINGIGIKEKGIGRWNAIYSWLVLPIANRL